MHDISRKIFFLLVGSLAVSGMVMKFQPMFRKGQVLGEWSEKQPPFEEEQRVALYHNRLEATRSEIEKKLGDIRSIKDVVNGSTRRTEELFEQMKAMPPAPVDPSRRTDAFFKMSESMERSRKIEVDIASLTEETQKMKDAFLVGISIDPKDQLSVNLHLNQALLFVAESTVNASEAQLLRKEAVEEALKASILYRSTLNAGNSQEKEVL
jgi:hypothetical protein